MIVTCNTYHVLELYGDVVVATTIIDCDVKFLYDTLTCKSEDGRNL